MVKYSPIESEFASSEEEAAYDAWLRVTVEAALALDEPLIPHADVMKQMSEIIAGHEQKSVVWTADALRKLRAITD